MKTLAIAGALALLVCANADAQGKKSVWHSDVPPHAVS